MKVAQRVVLNTSVLYIKIIITMVISLVSVPLILRALGSSDYGLYNLVAGLVTMLSFLNDSMTVSTQRFMSVSMGENNTKRINDIYNTSFFLHGILAICIAFLLEIIGITSIDKLNIDPNRMWCANLIFQFLVFTTVLRIVSVPYDAIINAHEDMIALSFIGIVESLILLSVAFSLQNISLDRLAFYGFSVTATAFILLILKLLWCRYKYTRYHINAFHKPNSSIIKEMLGFTGWNLFGGLAMMGRNQGVAVVINLFLGTLSNAAYGIANQINSAMSQFSSTFQKAINPQLMKSEGMGDRSRLKRISYISSKFSVLALGFISIPLIIEMKDVLYIWLHDDIPPFTCELAQCILALSMVYQFSSGLMSAIQATGNIRTYQVTMSIIILLNVPASYIILKLGYPVYFVALFFVLLEILSLVVRIFMAKKIVEINPFDFLKNVFVPVFVIILPSTVLALVSYLIFDGLWLRLSLVCLSYGVLYILLAWCFALEKEQRQSFLLKLKAKF